MSQLRQHPQWRSAAARGRLTDLLAEASSTVNQATHAGSGEPFRLTCSADGSITSCTALSAAGARLVSISNPTGWANQQGWWLDPPATRTA